MCIYILGKYFIVWKIYESIPQVKTPRKISLNTKVDTEFCFMHLYTNTLATRGNWKEASLENFRDTMVWYTDGSRIKSRSGCSLQESPAYALQKVFSHTVLYSNQQFLLYWIVLVELKVRLVNRNMLILSLSQAAVLSWAP